jgi:hypothetical protein
MRTPLALAPMLLCWSAAACGRGETAEPVLTPAARTSPAAERAIEALAATRCDHEERCNRIAPNAVYMSQEHCMNVMRADGYDELGVCRLGVDQDRLAGCLAALAGQVCGAELDRLERLAGCGTAELCLQ